MVHSVGHFVDANKTSDRRVLLGNDWKASDNEGYWRRNSCSIDEGDHWGALLYFSCYSCNARDRFHRSPRELSNRAKGGREKKRLGDEVCFGMHTCWLIRGWQLECALCCCSSCLDYDAMGWWPREEVMCKFSTSGWWPGGWLYGCPWGAMIWLALIEVVQRLLYHVQEMCVGCK